MPTTKITDLTAYTDPVNTDVLPIVDVTSDVTKKVSIADMMKNASLGSAAAPGISFDGDPNTGIYSPGADQVAISTNGTGRLTIDSSGNVNIDSGTVYVDAANNRLGVGTTNPAETLDVIGGSTQARFIGGTNLNGAIRIRPNGSAVYSQIAFDNAAGTRAGSIQCADGTHFYIDSAANGDIYHRTNGTGSHIWAVNSGASEALRVTSAGRVGIGNSSPGSLLHVGSGAASVYTDLLIGGASTANYGPKIGFQHGGTEIFEIANYGRVQGGTSTDTLVETVGSNKLQLGTNRTVALTIDTSQRVGIGTSSPARGPLHVHATSGESHLHLTNADTGSTDSDGFSLVAMTSVNNREAWLIQRENAAMRFYTNSFERAVIDSSGRLGVGTTSPSGLLSVHEPTASTANYINITNAATGASSWSNGVIFGVTTSGAGLCWQNENLDFLFGTNNTERLRIDSSGRLLVGTSSGYAIFNNSTDNPKFQFRQTGGDPRGAAFIEDRADSNGFDLFIAKSRGGSGTTIVNNGDQIGSIQFSAADGTNQVTAAEIRAYVDGTPGADDMPGRIVLATTADGASSPTERMRISNNGVVTIKNGAVAEIGTLTDAATITPNFASNCNFTVTLGGARTIANPTNVTAGQSGSIFIVQDATGGRTASWGSNWDWAGGTAPTLSTGANAVDRVDYICRSATSIHAVYTGNYS